jgi:hypothetical protein
MWWSARLSPAFEGLDDDHAPAAAGAWRPEVLRFVGIAGVGRRGDIQEFAGKREAGLAGGAGEQAVVPDAMEAAWQDVEQEAADELVGRERHHLLPINAVAAIVIVAEGDAALVEGDQGSFAGGGGILR